MILNNGTQYRSYDGHINRYYPMERKSFEQIMAILLEYEYHISVHTQQGKYIFEDKETYVLRHQKILMKSKGIDDPSLLPKTPFFTRTGFLKNVHEVKTVDELYKLSLIHI